MPFERGVSLTRQSGQENLRGGRGCRAVACFSRRPLQVMWTQRRFCGRHYVHKKRLLKYFQRSVRWVNCKLAMAVLTKRNIQEFKDKGFTQASYCILSSGQFKNYGYRWVTTFNNFCKVGQGIIQVMELQILPKKNDEVFFSLFKQPLTAAPYVLNIHVSSFFKWVLFSLCKDVIMINNNSYWLIIANNDTETAISRQFLLIKVLEIYRICINKFWTCVWPPFFVL